MTRHARDFRNTNIQVEPGTPLYPKQWYRSPLWTNNDHLPGQEQAFIDEELSWCGRALGVARDWDDEDYGGLWYSDRTSGKCGPCKQRQQEYDDINET